MEQVVVNIGYIVSGVGFGLVLVAAARRLTRS